jgi:hypothetical protein
MKIEFIRRKKGDLNLGLIYGGIGIFGFVGARFFSKLIALVPPCPFHSITGLPCPSCGTTRSGILLSQFRVLEAFRTNPFFVLVCVGVAIWALSAFILHIMGKRMRIVRFNESTPLIRVLLIGTILANWIYLILTRV